jgi:hypothetical protein
MQLKPTSSNRNESGLTHSTPQTRASDSVSHSWEQALADFLTYSGGSELITWTTFKLPDGPSEKGLWVAAVSGEYLAICFCLSNAAIIAFSAVNEVGCGVGRGPTLAEAKEEGARLGLECLRSFFGVKEGVLKEKIEKNPVQKSEPRRRKGWKSSISRGLQRIQGK